MPPRRCLRFLVHFKALNTSNRLSDFVFGYRDRANIEIYSKLECGPMPNVMGALPNIGGALCSTPQSLADAHY